MAEDNQLKVLYRKMLVDEATAESTKKYSIGGFEKKLLSDKALTDKIADLAVERNWAADKDDFYTKYFPAPKAPAIAKAAPVAPFQQPVEPMAMEGVPVGIAASKPTKAPAPSVTDYAREMAFEPQVEAPVKPIGVMAPQPIQEPIPSVTETAREMAFQPPAAPKKPKEKERGFMEWTGDVFGTISAGGERIAKNILAGIGHYAQAQAATDPMASLPYEKRQQMLQEAGQTMYDIADAAQKDFQNEVAKRNIETSVLQAIDKKQYKNIPEAVLYTVGDAAMQIIPSVLTMGGSTYLQTLPTAYKDGVEAIAKEKGISPEQVIASGEDAMVVASISSGFQSALENVGAGQVSKAIASKGAYKAVRDWLLKQNVNKNLARGAALLGVGIGEGTTEYFQEGVGQAGVIAAKSPTTKAFFERLPKELFTAEAEKQRQESFVGGLIGGGGLAGAGRAITKALEKPAKQPSITPEAEVAPEAPAAPESPIVPPVAPPAAPEVISAQEDEDLAALNEQITAIESAPVKEEVVAEQVPAAPIAPLNIDFLKNEGRNVNYQGVQGRIKIDSDGVPYVFTKDGDVVYIEGGLSGQTPQQLGVQPLADDVISETDIEAVLQDEGAPLDQGQLEYDFENNSITLYGKPFTYDGVEVNSKGQTTALRLKDANGKTKYVRNEDTILEFEIQKELYEKSKSNKPLTIESAIQAAEQLQVSPVARPEQVPQPVQQERPIGDIAEYEVGPIEEEVFTVNPETELFQTIIDNGEPVVSRYDAEKRIGDGERLFGYNEQDEGLVELSLSNLDAFPIDTIIAVRPEAIEAAPIEEALVAAEEEIVEAVPAPAPKAKKIKAQRSKQIDRKSVESALGDAKEEYRKSKEAFDKKRAELDKSTKEDVTDIFGARKAQEKSGGLFEMPRISPEQREKAIQPFRDRMNKAKEEVNRLTKMLEEGEEAGKEIEFKKEIDETKQLPRSRSEVREEEGGRVPEKGVPPSKPKKAKAVRKPGLIAQAKIIETQNPEILAIQGLISLGRLHPKVIEKIFGGGRSKNIQGERKARIGYLDKKSPHISTDGIAEKVAVFMAEALNMDVADVNERYNVRDYVEEAIKKHNSYASMAKEVIELDAQDRNAGIDEDAAYGEYLRQQEEQAAILGAEYNQDVADEVWDAAFNQMTEDDWNALDQMRIMDYLAQEEAEKNPLIDEINSLPLTRIEGLGMGQSQVSGVYISTEAENRYQAQRPDLPVTKVEVGIKNPYDAGDDFGLMEYRSKVLNDNKGEFTEFEYAEYEIPDGKVTVDDLNDEGIEKLAKLTQERLKSEGYDSVYFRETKDQEGELVVFDKNNVKVVSEAKPAPKTPETKGVEEGNKEKETKEVISQPTKPKGEGATILPSIDADKAEAQLYISQKRNYYTLWYRRRFVNTTRGKEEYTYSYNYLTILSQNLEDARTKALDYLNSIASGESLSVAFEGKNIQDLRGAKTIALQEKVVSPETETIVKSKSPDIKTNFGIGKYSGITIDELLDKDIDYAEWFVNNYTSRGADKTKAIIKGDPRYQEYLTIKRDIQDLERARIEAYEKREAERKEGKQVPVATLVRGEGGKIKEVVEETEVAKKKVEKKERRLVKDQITDIIPPQTKADDKVDDGLKPQMFKAQIDGANTAIASMDKNGVLLNGDGAGVGKTRQIIAVAKYYADKGKPVVIISENAAIGKPWESGKQPMLGGSMAKDSEAMGVNLTLLTDDKKVQSGGIYVSTYNRIQDADVPSGAIVIFDESQNLVNTFGRTPGGDVQEERQWEAKFRPMLKKAGAVAYYSATPADKPHQLAYLYKVLGFNSPEDFLSEMMNNGAIIKTKKYGKQEVKYYDVPAGRTQRARLYNWVNGLMVRAGQEGRFVKREISYEGTDVQFHDVKGTDEGRNEYAKEFNKVLDDLNDAEMMEYRLLAPNSYILYAAELSKIGEAVGIVKKQLAQGRKSIIFVSRINPMEIRGRRQQMAGEFGAPEVIGEIPSPVPMLEEALKKEGISFVGLHSKAKTTSQKAQKAFSEDADVLIASLESGGTGINLDDTIGDNPRTEVFLFSPYRGISTIQGMGRIWRASTIQNDNNPNRYVFVTASDISPDLNRSSVLAKKLQLMNAAIGGTAVSKLPMSKVWYDKEQLVGIELPDDTDEESSIFKEKTGILRPVVIDWKQSRKGGYFAKATADILEWMERGGPERTGLDIRVFKSEDGEWIALAGKNYKAEEFAPDNIPNEVAPSETESSFTSNQESSASEEFDGTKKPSKIKTKSFDNKYGKGAFERMQNITQNFEDIMDGLAEKIKQDCL